MGVSRIYVACEIDGDDMRYPVFACIKKYEMKHWIQNRRDYKYDCVYFSMPGKAVHYGAPVTLVGKEFFFDGSS